MRPAYRVSQLAAMAGVSRVTMWRQLRQHGIYPARQAITLATIEERWPALLRSLVLAETIPTCPHCRARLEMSCPGCHFSLHYVSRHTP